MTPRRTLLTALVCGFSALLVLAASGEIAGKWDFVFDTPGGERRATLEITAEGTQVTAKMGETVLKGTYEEGKLELKGNVHSSETGYAAELRIIGKMENEQLTGTAIWDTYQMSFTARRAQ